MVDAEVVDDGPGDDIVDPAARVTTTSRRPRWSTPTSSPAESLTFPRLHARTQRFTLGEPRTVEVTATGTRILFLRSRHGQDPINCSLGRRRGDRRGAPARRPRDAHRRRSSALPPDELARRERTREAAGGITSYAIDRDGTLAAFALAGRLFVCDVDSGEASELPVDGPVFDPRPDPAGSGSPTSAGAPSASPSSTGRGASIAGGDDEPETVTWGSADFIAAEEMRRHRGYWWSPDGSTIAATRVDTGADLGGVDRRPGAALHAATVASPTRSPGPTTPKCRCT